MLPESLEIVAEESFLDHLSLIILHQELHDFISVAHAESLRLLQRMHEVEVEGLTRISDESVGYWVVLVMESQTPWCLFTFALEADSRVELHSNWKIPLQSFLVVFEPHLLVVVDAVLGCVLIEQRLDIHQNVKQIVFPRRHDLQGI